MIKNRETNNMLLSANNAVVNFPIGCCAYKIRFWKFSSYDF